VPHFSRRSLIFACTLFSVIAMCAVAARASGAVLGSSAASGHDARALPGSSWGTAEKIPGMTSLNLGQGSIATSISCTTGGYCAAGGVYTDGTLALQAFVANEVSGVWKDAEEVPGTAALNTGHAARVQSVSCASAGNCSAGGYYTAGNQKAFVVNEVNGVWGKAVQVPGTATLSAGGAAQITVISCITAAALDCSAGGNYTLLSGAEEAFVVNETNGKWGNAEEVPNSGTLNVDKAATVTAISCASSTACSAVGSYKTTVDSDLVTDVFYVDKTAGTWGNAEEIPGLSAFNSTGTLTAAMTSISCSAPGDCVAGGSGSSQALLVTESGGTWGNAEAAPGTVALNTGLSAKVTGVSCTSTGNCSASGYYAAGTGDETFVMTETHGKWGSAVEVPGGPALSASSVQAGAISCSSPGNCSTGGIYVDAHSHFQAWLDRQSAGTWGTAIEVPGTAELNFYNAAVEAISCASNGACGADGYFIALGDSQQPFVDNLAGAAPGPTVTKVTPAAGPTRGGTAVTIRGSDLGGVKAVKFGAKSATHVKVVSAAEVTAVAPAGTGTVNVIVTGSGGSSAPSVLDRYTYDPAPAVTSLTPASGPAHGGNVVAIHGAHLAGTVLVKFGTKKAKIVSVSATTVRVIAPPGSGAVVVRVVTPGGTSASSVHARYTYH